MSETTITTTTPKRKRSSTTQRILFLGAALFICWFVTAAVTFGKMPDHGAHYNNLLADEIASKYDKMAGNSHGHHHPLAVAVRHKKLARDVHGKKQQQQQAAAAGQQQAEIEVPEPSPDEQEQEEQQHQDIETKPREGEQKLAANHKNSVHPVAGLDCSDHDGPVDLSASKEIVYWKDIPEDNTVVSPFFGGAGGERKYLSFEPDGGGWNNIRMSMETVLAIAVSTGRVLVLPPSQKMYLLGKTTFNFADFFPLQELAEEHEGLEIITTEQFLEETMGQTLDRKTGEVSFPPDDKKTKWDGDTTGIKSKLGPWLRSVALMPDCNPDDCILAFPKSTDEADAASLEIEFKELLAENDGKNLGKKAYEEFIDKPTPVDAPSKDRLREFLVGRSKILVYDKEHQDAKLVHFHGKAATRKQRQDPNFVPEPGGRLLVHFYAFLFFQDWRSDTWTKRFVRDHLRYVDHVQCAAARVIEKLRTTHGGTFDSFHIRRGDFQYKNTRVDAPEIVAAARNEIPEGRVVYVGTDERNKNFFKPLVEDAGWNIFFLDDFKDVIGEGIDPHYYGMIDQLVVSRGDRFFGCWFSTFTGYIMRLRGYHSQAEIDAGHPLAEDFAAGKLPHSFFYALKENKDRMHQYWPIKKAFYAREFPTAWLNIDAM